MGKYLDGDGHIPQNLNLRSTGMRTSSLIINRLLCLQKYGVLNCFYGGSYSVTSGNVSFHLTLVTSLFKISECCWVLCVSS